MTNRHSQRTHRGPSWLSIGAGGASAFILGGLSTAIVTGPTVDWRHLAGSLCAIVLAGLTTGQTVQRMVERRTIAERTARAREELLMIRALNTGTWAGDQPGDRLTIRWDPAAGRYFAEGWLGDDWEIEPETEWDRRWSLADVLTELETTGLLHPYDDGPTRRIRARLNLPPWTGFAPHVPVAPSPVQPSLADEDDGTRNLVEYRQTFATGAATLRPIQVPVFRTEQEREVWAREHDIPTEVLIVQPRDPAVALLEERPWS